MNAEYNGSCSLSVGNSTLPYFLTGLLSVIGLLSCGTLLYFNDNTVQRGLKHIDLFIPVYTTPTFYVIVVGTMFGLLCWLLVFVWATTRHRAPHDRFDHPAAMHRNVMQHTA